MSAKVDRTRCAGRDGLHRGIHSSHRVKVGVLNGGGVTLFCTRCAHYRSVAGRGLKKVCSLVGVVSTLIKRAEEGRHPVTDVKFATVIPVGGE